MIHSDRNHALMSQSSKSLSKSISMSLSMSISNTDSNPKSNIPFSIQTIPLLGFFPDDIVRHTLQILFYDYPTLLFVFKPSFYLKYYSRLEISKMVISCLKRHCELNNKTYFLQRAGIDEESKKIFDSPNFISMLKMVKKRNYPEFFLVLYDSFKDGSFEGEMNLPILKLIHRFDKTINFLPFLYYSIFNKDFEMMKWVCSLNEFLPWDERCKNKKSDEFFKHLYVCIAISGHIEMIEWLTIQNPPCPMDKEKLLLKAAHLDRMDIVEWMNGSSEFSEKLIKQIFRDAIKMNSPNVANWAKEKVISILLQAKK
jgi:hypothetical protein